SAAALPGPPQHHAHGAVYRVALRPLRWVLEGLILRIKDTDPPRWSDRTRPARRRSGFSPAARQGCSAGGCAASAGRRRSSTIGRRLRRPCRACSRGASAPLFDPLRIWGIALFMRATTGGMIIALYIVSAVIIAVVSLYFARRNSVSCPTEVCYP